MASEPTSLAVKHFLQASRVLHCVQSLPNMPHLNRQILAVLAEVATNIFLFSTFTWVTINMMHILCNCGTGSRPMYCLRLSSP
jgi:hypothetical protein